MLGEIITIAVIWLGVSVILAALLCRLARKVKDHSPDAIANAGDVAPAALLNPHFHNPEIRCD